MNQSFASPELLRSDKFTHPVDYEYMCPLHSYMKGKIKVYQISKVSGAMVNSAHGYQAPRKHAMNDDGVFGYKTVASTDDLLPCRHQILQRLLENKSGLSIESIATQLTISRAAVQQQFRSLEREGLIKKHDQMKTNGRPSTRYALTDRGIDCFPKHYLGLTTLIIQSLKDEMGSEQLIVYLKKLGVKLAKTYHPRFVGKCKHEQVKALIELMQDMGFHANFGNEAQGEDTEIRAYNCIYNDIAHKFQEICAFDTAFIQELLSDFKDQEINLHNCMAKGDGHCCFKLTI